MFQNVENMDLVSVMWVDSNQPVPKWQWLEDFEIDECPIIISVGYLIEQSARTVFIAPNRSASKPYQISGLIKIPIASIRSIEVLRREVKK